MWIKLWNWVNTRKTSIFGIVWAIVMFALGREYIQPDVADLVSAIMLILGFSVNTYNANQRSKGIV